MQPHGNDSFEVDRAVQDALDRLTLVANASEALSSTLELDPGLRRLCRVLVPAVADWCVIDLVEDEDRGEGRLRRAVVEHRDPDAVPPGFLEALLPPADDSSDAPLARALRGAGPLLLTDFPPSEEGTDALHRIELQTFQQLGAHRAVLVPLRARRQVLGVLTLVRTDQDGLEEQDRLPLIEDLAHRIAMAVDNARLHAEIATTAERLQRSLLPDLPDHGPLDIAARYDPARVSAEVGGDWYDAFLLPDGALTLIIGDVTGHDLKAAVSMSQMRNMLRGIACDRKEPPGKILARLDAANEILYPAQTLTCLYALVTKPEPDGPWLFHYGVAGHPAPLLVTRQGDARFLNEGRSLLLGADADTIRPDAIEPLPPDSTVLLYTDGLIERRSETFDDGMARLRQHAAALARAPLETFCDELMTGLGQASTDDIALIAVRIPPATSTAYTATAE
ncbi:PP2C family protein-serine/threonine phosphatase [Streptomyces sp. NPDC058200]|uniref:PP2C family protein-serine/threonine phosphatase n=1 Tax=Streptomyces sp. NPDC058200 TaxID=3346378 RepID=UPI0036E51153